MVRPQRDTLVARELARFAGLAVVAMILLGLLGLWVAGRVAQQESLRDAVGTATLLGETVLQPRLDEQLLAGSGAALRNLDRALGVAVAGTDVETIRLWDVSGTVVYSDEPRLIGEQFDLGDDVREALASDQAAVEVSDLSAPENRYEQGAGELVEVYLPVTAESGQRLLLEVYQRQSSIDRDTAEVWWSIVPLLAGMMVVLAAVVLGLAWWMARRLDAESRAREDLLHRALDASDTERQRIAADLHDGVVQDLVGISFTLAALRSQTADQGQTEQAEDLQRASEHTRTAVTSLRTLLVDIYPPNLQQAGLAEALRSVAERLQPDLVVTVACDDVGDVDPELQQAMYRIAREALQNVAKHSQAARAEVSLQRMAGHLELRIHDDGVGFDPTSSDTRHLGLRLIAETAEAVGGTLRVSSAPGQGTTVSFTKDDP